jgi:hypothetical protein
MIKEIFEIETKQKNTLIILIGIFGLSFLQLYLFKKSIFDIGIFFSIGVSFGMTICWSILNIPSLVVFAAIVDSKSPNIIFDENHRKFVLFSLGLIALGWIATLTYIAYELNLNFKYFLRLSICVSIIRVLFWVIYGSIKYRNTKI